MRGLLLALGIVALFLAVALADREKGILRWRSLVSDLAASEARIAPLQTELKGLASEIQALEADDLAIERAIREELELALPGESVVNLRRPPELPQHP